MVRRLSCLFLIALVGDLNARPLPEKRPIPVQKEVSRLQKVTTETAYNQILKEDGLRIVVFVSETCTACDPHKQALEAVVKNYPSVRTYIFDIGSDSYEALRKKLEIKAFPTTLFAHKGDKRFERGSMGEDELDGIIYELVVGKKKEQPTIKEQPASKEMATTAAA